MYNGECNGELSNGLLFGLGESSLQGGKLFLKIRNRRLSRSIIGQHAFAILRRRTKRRPRIERMHQDVVDLYQAQGYQRS